MTSKVSPLTTSCPECNKRPAKELYHGYCGYCARTKKVQAKLRDDAPKADTKSAPKADTKSAPKADTKSAAERRRLLPKCKRCDKSPIKEGCDEWCGTCYRSNAVKEERRRAAMGPHREFIVEPLDSADVQGIVRHVGHTVVLRIDATTNTYIAIGALASSNGLVPASGESLIGLTTEQAADYKTKWGFDYKYDPELRFTYASTIPLPSQVPHF